MQLRGGEYALFWLIWALCVHGAHICTHTNTLKHQSINQSINQTNKQTRTKPEKIQVSTEYSRGAVGLLAARLYKQTTGAMAVKPLSI